MFNQLAIITVIYENYNILQDFFASFSNQTNQNFTLFLTDLSKNRKEFAIPVHAQIIYGQNKGYAYGINLGLKDALAQGFDRFIVINSDTIVHKNFINSVLNGLEKHKASIIGGKIYYAKNYEYHKDRYRTEDLGKVIWYAGGEIDWKNVLAIHRGVDEVDNDQYGSFSEIDFVTGCLMCFDKKVIEKVGFWDEKYFLYYEDADYCERAKRKGIGLYYDPSIVIWHKNAQSTGGSGSKLHQKYQEKNRLRFGLKYAPLKTKIHLLKNYFCVIPNLIRDLF